MAEDNTNILPDLTDIEEVRKAIIANEILNRKYWENKWSNRKFEIINQR